MQNIVRFFVDRWQFSLILFGMLVALGLSSLSSIVKSEDPPAEFPIAGVTVILPGADAEQMEKLVVIPMEQAFSRIEDVKEIRATASSGVASVFVEFVWGVDPKRKYDEVVRELNVVRPTFPSGVIDVRTIRATSANTNILILALTSDDATPRQIESVARDLREVMERASGVQMAQIWGAPQSEVQVKLDFEQLALHRLSPLQVADALQREGADIPIGSIETGTRVFSVKATGPFDSLSEIERTVLRRSEGGTLTVADVADVKWGNDEARHITRYNGKPAVLVTAKGKFGEDVFRVRDSLITKIDAYRPSLPDNIKLEVGFDQSITVSKRLKSLGRDFLIAVFLVLLTLLPLGIRAAFVVMMAIPLSLAIGIFTLGQLGFTMNQLSIAGFVVALGLLVDDSIVVTENIARRLREGLSPRDAAVAGVQEINVAVLGCTATLVLAFLPLLFLPEGAGEFTRSLPLAVLVTIIASLFVSLTIIPFLAGRLLPRHSESHKNFVLDVVMGAIHAIYRPILRIALRFPLSTTIASLLIAGASFSLAPRLGFSLFPENDSPYFLIDIERPQGASVTNTDDAIKFVDGVLAKRDDMAFRFANTGASNPQTYYNVFESFATPNGGQIFAAFKEWHPNSSPAEVEEIRQELAKYPAARITFRRFENGPPVEAPISIRIWGKDIDTLTSLAAEVEKRLNAVEGSRDVTNPTSARLIDLEVKVDDAKAAQMGVPAGAVDQTLRAAVGGMTVAQMRDPTGDAFPVRMRLDSTSPASADDLKRLYVWTGQGAPVPLSDIAETGFDSGPTTINRVDLERVVSVLAYTQPGYLAIDVTRAANEAIADIPLPPGYRITYGGAAEAASESLSGLGTAMMIAVFGILGVLLLEFRTFALMTVVAFVIPFGIMGGIIALYLSGYPLSFIAIIGFIALVGIEIKNSILLVDFANNLRAEGVPMREAVERAGEIRFLPVLLTSMTAIGGLLPLVLESSPLYSPLAIVIIGGLISSTILARIVTPAMYMLLAPKDVAVKAEFAAAE